MHITLIASELPQEGAQSLFALAVFSSAHFPILPKLKKICKVDLSQTIGPILQGGVGHFPFWLFSFPPLSSAFPHFYSVSTQLCIGCNILM